MSAASLTENPDCPLKPLVKRGYVHGTDDFDDMETEPDVWMKEIELGILPDNTYGIGEARQFRGLVLWGAYDVGDVELENKDESSKRLTADGDTSVDAAGVREVD